MTELDKKNTIRHILAKKGLSSFQKYKLLTTGDVSFHTFFLTEVFTFLLGPLPGALGIFLRSKIYPFFFKKCGNGAIIGRNCTFRHFQNICLGENVIIDDNCQIDAKGCGKNGIVLKDNVIINQGTSIKSKSGDILIGESVTIGANSWLVSWAGIKIGRGSAIAPGCYMSAGKYDPGELGTPIMDQTAYSNGPIIVEENVWIATRVTILDSVRIGRNTIVSSGSVVGNNIPFNSIVSGNPARIIFTRR